MTRALLVAVGASMLLPGCVLIPVGHRGQAVVVERCRPNEYWDGHECRHKGKGHGARKHDHDDD
ncbi:MAG TPA: hypothetical protein VIG99_21815 [Myxococcaceae bacterium]